MGPGMGVRQAPVWGLMQLLLPFLVQLLPWNPAEAAELPGRFLCGKPATPISVIQGTGRASALAGQDVDIEGIVTARFPGKSGLGGFFVQQDAQTQEDPA